ncbi:hypothetical protein [Anatilimnocola floriformis]|uniref:hypothetical protein n=1 Tax=Anatilimnocola floriformis TaxID=2948575 RepID=UPI0020C1BCDB|nr:hypothetical protein [Anatilimnocola floriformis]
MNESQSTTNQSKPQRRGPGFFWLLALLLGGVVLITEIPNQRRAWKFASALEARDAGEKARATEMLNELLKQQPKDEQYLRAQYLWNKEDGKYELALEYVQDQLTGAKEGSHWYMTWISERSRLYQHLHRYQDAIADSQELVHLSEKIGTPTRQEALNGLAYARALGGKDLDAALADADTAVAGARANLKDAENLMSAAVAAKKKTAEASEMLAECRASVMACVDTRGLVNFKKSDFAAAQRDFDEAVENLLLVREFHKAHEKADSTQVREYKQFAKKQQERDHNDAVIYYHRSLNLKELGREEDADRDWKRAAELLGREPGDDLF